MPTIRCNFGQILQALEDKLVDDAVVADRAQVTWSTSDSVPQLSGPFDILLRARRGERLPEDGGAWDFRLRRYVDIILRSQAIKETGGNYKTWVSSQFELADKIMDSMSREGNDFSTFQPSKGNDLLTTMPIIIATDAPPEKLNEASAWGDSVCTLEIHYMPLVKPKGP